MTFQTALLGTTATGLEVPASYVVELGGGKRPPVVVSLNGLYSYRSTVMPYDGQILVPVSREHREAAGLKAGDLVTVTLTLDTEPRTVEVPADLAEALDAVPGARAAFDKLAPSHKKAHVSSVEEAKSAETRLRRIRKVIEALSPSHS